MKRLLHNLKLYGSAFFSRKYSWGFIKELNENIFFLQDPFGDEPHRARHDEALKFLLQHAEHAHPRLLYFLKSHKALNPHAIIEALPYFGRPESIPLLKDILYMWHENLVDTAADALAQHPDNRAFVVLLDALSLPRDESVIAAADGLLTRGNSDACPELLKHLHHENPEVRFHVIQAAVELDCLDKEELKKIAENDPDDDIKNLIKDFVAT